MEPIKTLTAKDKTLKIFMCNNPENPRMWDNLGTMICFHKRYTLGDKHDYKSDNYSGWAEMKKAIEKKEKAAIVLPLYLYDHSGITMKTTPFGDRWDSGQIGFIVVSKEKLRKAYNTRRINRKILETAEKVLLGEVETYDQYLRGAVYGFKVFKNDKEVDSCWGFYGDDFKTNGIIDYIEDTDLEELLKNS